MESIEDRLKSKGGEKRPEKDGDYGERKKKPSNLELIKICLRNTTVEPLIGFYIIPCVLASLATQNLSLDKACRVNLRFNSSVCDALVDRNTKNYTQQETEVQQLVAAMSIWKTILQSSIPAVLIVFLGSWSDRNCRRKPLMLIPVIGECCTVIGLLFCTYFFYELPMEVAGLCESLFPALTGGWMTMFMAVFSYIGDVTSVENRTLRIGVVNVFCSLGVPIGTALSGILYKLIGYYGVFSISACMYMIGLSYGVLFIKDSTNYFKAIQNNNNNNNNVNSVQVNSISNSVSVVPVKESLPPKKSERVSCCAFLRDFFDFKHFCSALQVTFKSGDKDRKTKIVLLMIAIVVIMGPLHGEMHVSYLFARYRFNWDELDYSIFSTFSMITSLVGTSISVGVFSHLLKIDDSLIGVMSCMSKILAGFIYAYAPTETIYYLGSLVDIVNGTSFIAVRSIISKLVPADELGKVNSIFGVSEALVPLIYGPMYSAVYSATLHSMPGAFYLLGGALTMPAVIIFLWIYFNDKRQLQKLQSASKCPESQLPAIDGEELSKVTKVEHRNNHNTLLCGVTNQGFQSGEILNNCSNGIKCS
ncbi:unnamed protein product [Bemisia tabaci]|uniref:Uncharacterized protein n=1 Tax=Bemisia tabaci TaxID=7038 RepID=A0A9P0ACR4_BEMTA|nr:unnamed protein product [Bemisia tabaci]